MQRNISIAVAATLLAALSLAVFYSNRTQDADGTTAEDVVAVRAELEDIRSELTKLRRRVHTQNTHPSSAQPRGEAAEGAADAEEPEASEAREQTPPGPPNVPETEAEFVGNLSARFSAQSVDAAWSRDAAHVADGDIRPLLPAGSRITAIECKSSMCRAESLHQDMDKYHQFTRAMIHADRKWQGPAMVVVVDRPENGPVKSVMYLAKLGEDLLALATPME